jgi:hypothetical protein
MLWFPADDLHPPPALPLPHSGNSLSRNSVVNFLQYREEDRGKERDIEERDIRERRE